MTILTDSCVSCEIVDRRFEQVDVFKAMMERSGLCIASLDVDGRVIDANPEFLRQFGRSIEALRGRHFLDLLHPGVHASVRRQFDLLASGRRERFADHMAGIADGGGVFAAELTGVAVHDASGDLVMTVVVVAPDEDVRESALSLDHGFSLSELDAKILERIANGESTVRIAAKLFISPQCVEYHVGIMFRKLKVPNRAALVSKAFSMALFNVASWPPKVLSTYVK